MWITWKVIVRETCFCEKIQADYTLSWVFQKYFHFVPQGRRNIYQQVKEFQKQECQSRNFQAIMEWLKETIKLSNLACKNKVTADLTIKTEKDAVKIKARTKHLECYIYEWEWQKKCKTCITHNFMFCRKNM